MLGLCCFWKNRVNLTRKVALRRIERELDIENFIKSNFEMKTLLRALTTKYQREMARNSYKFIVGETDETSTTSDSDFDLSKSIPNTKIDKKLK